MGVQKNATYKVHNGTDFDEINFKTIAAQVKMASGVDLESGFASDKSINGHTKLPNGLIIQWGYVWPTGITAGGSVSGKVTLPFMFPNKELVLITNAELARDTGGQYQYNSKFYMAGSYFTSKSSFDYKVKADDYMGGSAVFSYIALGY